MHIVVRLILALPLAGCGFIQAQNQYNASAEKYKQCLAANPNAPQQCEGLRLILEVDERRYNAVRGIDSPTITIQNR